MSRYSKNSGSLSKIYIYFIYKKNLDWFSGSNFDPGILDEWPEGIRILRKLAKRSDDSEISRRRLKTKFVGDVEVVVKGNVIYKRDELYILVIGGF